MTLAEFAPAKVNLTLAVEGKRPDGYHELSSLVAFAALGDDLSLVPGPTLSLAVEGPFAPAAGDDDANLVLKAARALARRVDSLALGAFALNKHIPVAAGLGGGSADAAAALRLLARLNRLPPDHAAVLAAAAETGSDVPVCLAGGCRMMGGRGERLGPALPAPALHAVLVNPGVALATARVFQALAECGAPRSRQFAAPGPSASPAEWLAAIAACGNDLEAPALALQPAIITAREALSAQAGCALARVTGSGATVFGLFEDEGAARRAATRLREDQPGWWVRATVLSG